METVALFTYGSDCVPRYNAASFNNKASAPSTGPNNFNSLPRSAHNSLTTSTGTIVSGNHTLPRSHFSSTATTPLTHHNNVSGQPQQPQQPQQHQHQRGGGGTSPPVGQTVIVSPPPPETSEWENTENARATLRRENHAPKPVPPPAPPPSVSIGVHGPPTRAKKTVTICDSSDHGSSGGSGPLPPEPVAADVVM